MVDQKFWYASTLGQDYLGQRWRNFTFMGPHNNFFRQKIRYSKSRDTLTYVDTMYTKVDTNTKIVSTRHSWYTVELWYTVQLEHDRSSHCWSVGSFLPFVSSRGALFTPLTRPICIVCIADHSHSFQVIVIEALVLFIHGQQSSGSPAIKKNGKKKVTMSP